MCDRGGTQRTLPVSSNAQNGAVGQKGIYPHPAQTPGNAQAAVPVRGKPVVSTVAPCQRVHCTRTRVR